MSARHHRSSSGSATNLGAIRAESDSKMLETAFVRTADFEMLRAGPTHNFVVGRRGAGKSALYLGLLREFRRHNRQVTIEVRPEEYQMRGLVSLVRDRLTAPVEYNVVRALLRVVWRSAILGQVAQRLTRERPADFPNAATCVGQLAWVRTDLIASMRALLELLPTESDADNLVYRAADVSTLEALEECVRADLGDAGLRAVVIVDGLDEGWRPQVLEAGILGGFCGAAVDLRDKSTSTHVLLFLRDNMFRMLGELDDDFSRNIAGDNLRLTWNQETLFDLVVRRLRAARGWPEEASVRTWNRFARRELAGKDGFAECLRYTLYRPRDVLELLNHAAQAARRAGDQDIIGPHVDEAARDISVSRLHDLFKEYEEVLPGLRSYVHAFSGRPAIDTLENVLSVLSRAPLKPDPDAAESRARLGTPYALFQALFTVGFLGTQVTASGFQFCHDGTDVTGKQLPNDTRVAIHPCYARALDVQRLEPEQFDVLLPVNDEYDEESPDLDRLAELMARGTTKLLDQLPGIVLGEQGAAAFEQWVFETLSLLLAEGLENFKLHPNGAAPQRRDVVASIAGGGFWGKIGSCYAASQILFEVKNFERLTPEAFAQARAYTGGPYGKISFIVYRSLRNALDDNERTHVQQHYIQGNLLVLVPVAMLRQCLQKQVKGSRRDYTRKRFQKWIDRHERSYINPRVGRKSG